MEPPGRCRQPPADCRRACPCQCSWPLRSRAGPPPVGDKLASETRIQPDLVYVSNERASLVTERGVMGAPDLVVEVLSPRTRGRDLGVKMRRYAAAGVPHYWIMDRGPRELR